MPAALSDRPESERQLLQHERLALAPGLPAAAFGLMHRQAPSVLRAITEQATTLPDEPDHMTQLKAVCSQPLAAGCVGRTGAAGLLNSMLEAAALLCFPQSEPALRQWMCLPVLLPRHPSLSSMTSPL